jgi:hypothetical protein
VVLLYCALLITRDYNFLEVSGIILPSNTHFAVQEKRNTMTFRTLMHWLGFGSLFFLMICDQLLAYPPMLQGVMSSSMALWSKLTLLAVAANLLLIRRWLRSEWWRQLGESSLSAQFQTLNFTFFASLAFSDGHWRVALSQGLVGAILISCLYGVMGYTIVFCEFLYKRGFQMFYTETL